MSEHWVSKLQRVELELMEWQAKATKLEVDLRQALMVAEATSSEAQLKAERKFIDWLADQLESARELAVTLEAECHACPDIEHHRAFWESGADAL